MKIKKELIFLWAIATSLSSLNAQKVWHSPFETDFYTVQNQAWPEELNGTFQRIPDRAKDSLRNVLWDLSLDASGLALFFDTDAPEITVQYVVNKNLAMPHMPATGVSGVDMYRVSKDGTQEFCYGSWNFGDTVRYNYTGLEKLPQGETAQYRLNLPLFNNISELKIGVPQNSNFTFLPRREEKPIVIYGTSIVHGACASRPGMSWANITRRNLNDYPIVNLGFSGNGQLEPAVIDLLNEIDAELYVLDCMPNLNSKKPGEAHQLVLDAVKQIRGKSDTPILLIEHAGYSNDKVNKERKELYSRLNREQKQAYDELLSQDIKNLYYLSREELGLSPDAWVDYVHPSDLGATEYSKAVTAKIKEILPDKFKD